MAFPYYEPFGCFQQATWFCPVCQRQLRIVYSFDEFTYLKGVNEAKYFMEYKLKKEISNHLKGPKHGIKDFEVEKQGMAIEILGQPVLFENSYERYDTMRITVEGLSTVAPATAFTPVPAGNYILELESIEAGQVSKTARKLSGAKVTYKIVDNPNADLNGRKLFTNWWYCKESAPFLKQELLALGATVYDDNTFDSDQLPGLRCAAILSVVNYKKNDGTDGTKNEVTQYIKLPAAGVKEMAR